MLHTKIINMTHAQMEIEKPESTLEQAVLTLDDTSYTVNIEEVEAFISECRKFMPLHNHADFELMTQEISDSLVEYADGNVTMEQIRPQLLFLREVGFLLKSLLTPTGQN